MGTANIKCPKCENGIIKRRESKQCMSCYQSSRNKSFCKGCGIKLLHSASNYCFRCFANTRCGEKNPMWVGGLPNCSLCGNKLSVYKNSNQYNTGICQKCYKGDNTKRWNNKLTEEDREQFRTKQPKYYEWRKLVFERDRYSCQKCGDKTGGNLCSHHIENYSENKEKRFDIDNGITLCERCHIEFHKNYGWKLNTREQIDDYIAELAISNK